MKLFKLILPVIINIIVTFLFYIFVDRFLIYSLKPDFYYYLGTGIEGYRFGVGSVSLSFIIWLFWATFLFIIRIDKKYLTLCKKTIYYISAIGITALVDLYWVIFYDKYFFIGEKLFCIYRK